MSHCAGRGTAARKTRFTRGRRCVSIHTAIAVKSHRSPASDKRCAHRLLYRRTAFLILNLDGCAANSSNSPVPCGSVYRMHDNPGAFLPDILDRRGLRGHPSYGSHDGASRTLEPKPPAVLQRLQPIRLPQERRSEIARLQIGVHGSYR